MNPQPFFWLLLMSIVFAILHFGFQVTTTLALIPLCVVVALIIMVNMFSSR